MVSPTSINGYRTSLYLCRRSVFTGGVNLAETLGLQQAFVGILYVDLVASLAEIAVTISALRIGALDVPVGDSFGSNLFDMVIVDLYDLLYILRARSWQM
ncbi:hypothetical protein MCAMS1_02574 [biofilm metagenome]